MKKTEALCFGLVGARCFCRSSDCRIKTHQKKMKMGCNLGWFIATKSQVFTGKPAAFVTPFLDSSKITEDTLATLADPLTMKRTAEWEAFIIEAQEEWREFEACHPLRAVVEQSSSQEGDLSSNDDNS
jgi:hypothetical protein